MSIAAGPPHSSPQRPPVRAWILLAALIAGPGAWIVQLSASYGATSLVCFPHNAPHLVSPPPGWSTETAWLTGLNLVCLGVTLGVAALSWRNWRRLGGKEPADSQSILAIARERARFLALCGLFVGSGFSIAILFDILQPHLIASCWRFAQ
ncbi:MAG: hypothetical protein ABI376_09540 [Caulobacteraceae bacterium]